MLNMFEFLDTTHICVFIVLLILIGCGLTLKDVTSKEFKYTVVQPDFSKNPLKGVGKNVTIEDVDKSLLNKIDETISAMVTYDATAVDCLERFKTISNQTQCLFAKNAILWGSTNWEDGMSMEQIVLTWIPTFLKFTMLCSVMALDGFVIEIPGALGSDIKVFGDVVRQILSQISDKDPYENKSMTRTYITRPSWVFRFHRESFFITTFAPCYPETNSRYSFGNTSHAYVLLQPEISFARHDIPNDTSHTNWNHPKTVRDHIRKAFSNAGREYTAFEPGRPLVFDIVKPLTEDVDHIAWWINNKDSHSKKEK